MNANYNSVSNQALRRLADETEETLKSLKDELDRREQRAQHLAIEHLEQHFASAELSLQAIKKFFAEVLAELRQDREASPGQSDRS